MNKKEKLKLIRKMEEVIGFEKFNLNIRSSVYDIDNVLSFIYTASIVLEETFKPIIEDLKLKTG